MFCVNEYDIQMSLYIFWLRKGYVRNWWGDGTYYLVKMWSENSNFILIHPGINHFWTWVFGGAVYQEEEEAKMRSRHWWATFL